MKKLSILAMMILILAACGGKNTEKQSDEEQTQAEAVTTSANTEATEGEWEVLFDGSSLDKWRGFKKEAADVNGWRIEEGTLTTDGDGGDLITKEQYDNFILELEWKISKGGNSGVIYRSLEDGYTTSWHTGPEYQIIDGDGYKDPLEENQLTGANYALHPPLSRPLKTAGEEFNHTKIVVNDSHVEHWLNGEKVVEYELWSPEWEAMVKETKFVDTPDYGKAKKGHIALQGHGDKVWFKNIRIQKLEPSS